MVDDQRIKLQVVQDSSPEELAWKAPAVEELGVHGK